MNAPLQVSALSKSYGGRRVLNDIDMAVAAGEAVALVGPNGAGKTTLLGCVSGTVIADGGTIIIGGHDLVREPLEARRGLRYLTQESDVPAGVTGREILALLSDVHGEPGAVQRAVDFVDLGPAIDHLATTYSVGMRRRLLFAGVLPGAPALYVLDEPFAGVDGEGRAKMLDALRTRLPSGAGVLIAAHDANEAELGALGARVIELPPQS